MAKPIGSKKIAGRKPGTLNKRTQDSIALAESLGVDPLKFLLLVVKADYEALGISPTKTMYSKDGTPYEVETIPLDMRCHAASDALQYLRPKLKALEVTAKTDEPKETTVYIASWSDADKSNS